MKRYRIYDIEQGNIYGASGSVVKSFKTSKQAKNWIDKEVKLGEKKINFYDLKAWYTGDGNWTIAEDNGILGTLIIGYIKTQTNRKHIEDHFGMKKFRVKVTSKVQINVRVTYSDTLHLKKEYQINKSQIATVKETMKLFNVFRSDARRQMEQTARQQQKYESEIMDCYDPEIERHLSNLWALINK